MQPSDTGQRRRLRTSSGGSAPDIALRTLREPRVLREAVELQIDVWGMDPRDTMPWSLMLLVERHGGVVLGASDGPRLVGFLYSFAAYDGREPFLYSKMLGVARSHRGLGIGRKLKRRQRREALRRGYRRIQWTFDPLERSSAVLNAGHLGVRARAYTPSFYGVGGIGALHAGLDSDRLVAEWLIAAPETARRQRRRSLPGPPGGATVLVDVATDGVGPRVTGARWRFPALVAVPPDIQALKRASPATARAWQRALRDALVRALASGGEVTDVARTGAGEGTRDYYVLTARRDGEAAGRRVRMRGRSARGGRRG